MALLANGLGGQKNGHQAILPPRQAIGRMASHLKQRLTVAPFVTEHSWRGPLDGQIAQHKGSRRKSQILSDRYAFQANASIASARRSFCLEAIRSGACRPKTASADSQSFPMELFTNHLARLPVRQTFSARKLQDEVKIGELKQLPVRYCD